MVSIGIDFGTSYCSVAGFKDGKIKVIPNDQDKLHTPSYVAFTDTGRLFGDAAIHQEFVNMGNTIYGIKQLVGRCFDDSHVAEDGKKWGFDVVDDKNKPIIPIQHTRVKRWLTAEQICAMLLSHMKRLAEKYLDEDVIGAVISVPSNFYNSQRCAVKNAGCIAGLKVEALINETTAAAITFGLSRRIESLTNVLIFDLGAGSFDVSVVTIKEGVFKVLATEGNSHLGGINFDDRMVEHFQEKFFRETRVNVVNKKSLNRLRTACEKAKRTLSGSARASLRVDGFFEKHDFEGTITREEFDALNQDIFDKLIKMVKSVLHYANLNEFNIGEIIPIGGSTRIPKLREMLCDLFNGKELNRTINPDEAVVFGAAAFAGNWSSRDFSVSDVTPRSIGVKLSANKNTDMGMVVPRHTEYQTKKWINLTVGKDNWTTYPLRLEIYEGESNWANDNMHTCTVHGCLRGRAFELHINVDSGGMLSINAFQQNKELKIECVRDIDLTRSERQQMIAEEEAFQNNDDDWKKKCEARNALEKFTYSVKQTTRDRKYRSKWKKEEKDAILERCEEIFCWLQDHWNANPEEFQKQHGELATTWIAVLNNIDPDKSIQLQQRETERVKQIEELNTLQKNLEFYGDITCENEANVNSTAEYFSQKLAVLKRWISRNTKANAEALKTERHKASEAFEAYLEEQKEQENAKQAEIENQRQRLTNAKDRAMANVEEIRKILGKDDFKLNVYKKEKIRELCRKLQCSVENNEPLAAIEINEEKLKSLWTSVYEAIIKESEAEAAERMKLRNNIDDNYKKIISSFTKHFSKFSKAEVQSIQDESNKLLNILSNEEATEQELSNQWEKLSHIWNETKNRFKEANSRIDQERQMIVEMAKSKIINIKENIENEDFISHLSVEEQTLINKQICELEKLLNDEETVLEDINRHWTDLITFWGPMCERVEKARNDLLDNSRKEFQNKLQSISKVLKKFSHLITKDERDEIKFYLNCNKETERFTLEELRVKFEELDRTWNPVVKKLEWEIDRRQRARLSLDGRIKHLYGDTPESIQWLSRKENLELLEMVQFVKNLHCSVEEYEEKERRFVALLNLIATRMAEKAEEEGIKIEAERHFDRSIDKLEKSLKDNHQIDVQLEKTTIKEMKAWRNRNYKTATAEQYNEKQKKVDKVLEEYLGKFADFTQKTNEIAFLKKEIESIQLLLKDPELKAFISNNDTKAVKSFEEWFRDIKNASIEDIKKKNEEVQSKKADILYRKESDKAREKLKKTLKGLFASKLHNFFTEDERKQSMKIKKWTSDNKGLKAIEYERQFAEVMNMKSIAEDRKAKTDEGKIKTDKCKELTRANEARQTILNSINKFRHDVTKLNISTDGQVKIGKACNDATIWLSRNNNATYKELNVEKIKLTNICQPIVKDAQKRIAEKSVKNVENMKMLENNFNKMTISEERVDSCSKSVQAKTMNKTTCAVSGTPQFMTIDETIAKNAGKKVLTEATRKRSTKHKRASARESLMELMADITHQIKSEKYKDKLTENEKHQLEEKCTDTHLWCSNSPSGDEKESREKEQDLDNLWKAIQMKIKQREENVDTGKSKNVVSLRPPKTTQNEEVKQETISHGSGTTPSMTYRNKLSEYYEISVEYFSKGKQYRQQLSSDKKKEIGVIFKDVRTALSDEKMLYDEEYRKYLEKLQTVVDPEFKRLGIDIF